MLDGKESDSEFLGWDKIYGVRGKMISIDPGDRCVPAETYIIAQMKFTPFIFPERTLDDKSEILKRRLPSVGSGQNEIHIVVGSGPVFAIRNSLQKCLQPVFEAEVPRKSREFIAAEFKFNVLFVP
jgi:hypothetical protein